MKVIKSFDEGFLINGKTYSWNSISSYRLLLYVFMHRMVELKIKLINGKTITFLSDSVYIDMQNNRFTGKRAVEEFLKTIKSKNNNLKKSILFKREIVLICIALAIIPIGIILSELLSIEMIRFVFFMIGVLILSGFSRF